jgi:hypothetical protein
VQARLFTLALIAAGCAAQPYRVATFRADATPALGEPLIWVDPAKKIEDPLWLKGIVLEDGTTRYVLCAIDWCGVGGATWRDFRKKIAAAAGTSASRVALHSVHQHTAPYIDGDGYRILRQQPSPPLIMSERFLTELGNRMASAVKAATAKLEAFDQIGTAEARVVEVASARRIMHEGKLLTRFSGAGKAPLMAALPEGPIDPGLKTITFARRGRPLARLHYYATHPQTFCCDGRVSGDFVNAAREKVEHDEGVFQLYFTGCAGDVTVGKYNDGSEKARAALAGRLEQGMKASIAATRWQTPRNLRWRTVQVTLPSKPVAEGASTGDGRYRTAIARAYAERKEPLELSSLEIGGVSILHLPGEPMLEFQRYAQSGRPAHFVAVAGYGDISPGYLCTDKAVAEGGYEPSASHAAPGAEARLKRAILELLGK